MLKDKLKMSKFENQHQKALLNLYYTVHNMLSKEKEFLSKYNITSQQYNLLKILKGQNQNPISIKEIRSRMLDKHSDIGRIVARLEKKALVIKQVSEFDKRAMNIAISKKGIKVLSKIDAIPLAKWGTGIYKIKNNEAADLNTLLDKINKE